MDTILLLITVPLTVFAVAFAIANPQDVTINLEPFLPGTMQASLGAVALGMMGAGFFFGAFFVWMHGHKTRFQHWKQSRRLARMEKELEAMQAKGGAPG